MPLQRWVYNLATRQLLRGGFYDPAFDELIEGVTDMPEDFVPPTIVSEVVLGKGGSPGHRVPLRVPSAPALAEYDSNANVRATVRWALTRELGRDPTAAELAVARNDWAWALT